MTNINSVDELADMIRHPNNGTIGAVSAAYRVLEKCVVIPRSELPEVKVIDRDGATHVDCGSSWGTWDVKNIARMRTIALEDVAAWVTAEEWNAKESAKNATRNIRRDELCEELGCPGLYPTLISTAPMKLAIDRIIDLEQAAK